MSGNSTRFDLDKLGNMWYNGCLEYIVSIKYYLTKEFKYVSSRERRTVQEQSREGFN